MDIGIHNCTNIEVEAHRPWNANSITLKICNRPFVDGKHREVDTSITLYDLPQSITNKLMHAFGENTKVSYKPADAA